MMGLFALDTWTLILGGPMLTPWDSQVGKERRDMLKGLSFCSSLFVPLRLSAIQQQLVPAQSAPAHAAEPAIPLLLRCGGMRGWERRTCASVHICACEVAAVAAPCRAPPPTFDFTDLLQANLGDLSGLESMQPMVDGGEFDGAKAYKDAKVCNMLTMCQLHK